MTTHSRLALVEDVSKFTDGEFASLEGDQDSQTGRLSDRAQLIEKLLQCSINSAVE